MALIPAPKEVLAMGRIKRDPESGKPVFPDTATEEQVSAYYEWHRLIKSENEPKIEE